MIHVHMTQRGSGGWDTAPLITLRRPCDQRWSELRLHPRS